MTTHRPISTSFPLGLFCNASWSLSPHRSPSETETTSIPLPLDRELLDMPTVALETDALNEDLAWHDQSA